MFKKCLIIIFILLISALNAQLKVVSKEKILLPENQKFNMPKFSNKGEFLLFTDMNYDGIWKYDISTKKISQLTDAPKSGYEFSISEDDRFIAYRKTYYSNQTDRVQEIYKKDISTGKTDLIDRSEELSTPRFLGSDLLYTNNYIARGLDKNQSKQTVSVIGIEFGKVVINKFGEKTILDPFGNGSYIWPVLSANKKLLLAYEADRGTFICDIEGNILNRFGRLDAAQFIMDDKWIVYMNDTDDGQRMLSSNIKAISTDGKISVDLTDSKNSMDLNPSCSRDGKKVVYNNEVGEIFILSLEEVK